MADERDEGGGLAPETRAITAGRASNQSALAPILWATTTFTYDTVDEAVALANDTDYGLNASVWGTDLDAATAVARRIESGNVNINDILATAFASKGTPSGGVKASGVGARHGDQGLLKCDNPTPSGSHGQFGHRPPV